MSRTTDGSPEIPPYDKMFWPTLQAIKQLGDSGSKQEIEDRAIELAGYSEAQQSILHGDGPQTEIRYRLAWARTYLKKVEALTAVLRVIDPRGNSRSGGTSLPHRGR